MTEWKEKVAIITGGSAGLGKAIGKEFGRCGMRVVLAARNKERLEEATRELREAGIDAEGIPTDVTDDAMVIDLIRSTIERYQRIDVLVNCAGKSSRGNAMETPPEKFRELWELNFLATVRCVRAAASHLIASQGHLINIGSLAGKAASRYLGAYPASKSPLVTYSQQLRFELGPKGVHVLLVSPGPLQRSDAGRRYDTEAEGLPSASREPGGGVKIKGTSADRLAFLIRKACERRSPELTVPGKARLLFSISQLWPRFGDWMLGRLSK